MGTTFKELFKLYDLIQNGDARSVERFLTDNTTDVNVILPCKGIGVLHLAVGVEPPDKSKECTELLMKYGGDPNLCNDDGITPVHIAAIWGRVDNLKLLIGCGGDPSQRDMDGHSAFDYAVKEQQWDVYDYLHNVVDQKNDSGGSQCAYTLNLDKILVTTDQIEAVYEPAREDEADAKSIRKSELVRDWCEKTCLMMNKLYPTILSDTYLIDNESVPWKPGEFSNNLTMDLTSNKLTNDTDISFKTCLSRKVAPTLEITGVQALEKSLNDSQDNNCSCCCEKRSSQEPKKRVSLYEYFSLPGSPNSIAHRNYNSKSSLKRSKDRTDTLALELKSKLTFNESQLTEDQSVDLDRALAVAQNKTNEWLSSSSECCASNVNAFNTRRSSASSGVSSNVSGGSMVLASMHEEYKYQDTEEGVVLLEKRLLVSSVVLPVDDSADLSPDQTILSIASSLPTSVDYDNNTLRAELLRLGFRPGPIRDNTRRLYLKKLKELKRRPVVVNNQGKSYSIELEKSLRTDEWMKDLTPYMELESKVRADFANSNRKWREGSAKTSFTYLLLDPRLTNNLPARATKQSQHVSWVTFINSIFYVGKGKRSRPYSHLYQAVTLWKRDFTTSKDKKVQHILDIWSDKVGVVCLHIFQNVIPAEAYTNEAAMIDALGVANLKNLKSGNYYGAAGAWPLKERRMFGLYLLYKAMLIFLSEGERQLRPEDID